MAAYAQHKLGHEELGDMNVVEFVATSRLNSHKG
jgi:hypothetical protein